MEFFNTDINFVASNLSEENGFRNVATGDMWFILGLVFLFIALVAFIFYIVRKNKINNHSFFGVEVSKALANRMLLCIPIITISASLIFGICYLFSINNAYANNGEIDVSPSVNATVDFNSTQISVENAQFINQSNFNYNINQITLDNNDGFDNHSLWTIKVNDISVFEAYPGQTTVLDTPITVNAQNILSISIYTDMKFESAKNVIGKNPIKFSFGLVKIGQLYDLKVNDQIKPNDVGSNNLKFSWKINNNAKGSSQSAYQINVDTASGYEIFNTGKVDGELGKRSTNIYYLLDALDSSENYKFSVVTWDNYGNKLEVSSSEFSTSLIHEGELDDAEFLSFNDPRLQNPNDRASKNFSVEYDIVHEQSESRFCFCLTDRKNCNFFHLENFADEDKLRARFAYSENGVNHYTDYYTFDDICYSTQVLNKCIHVKIDSNYDDTSDVQSFIATITLEDGSVHSTSPQILLGKRNLNKIGILSDVHSQTYVSNITNIVAKNINLGQGDSSIVYKNDFSSGRLGFYHDYSAHIVLDENGQSWIRVGTTTPDSNWGNEPLVEYYNSEGNFPVFRNEFDVSKQISSAKLYTAGLGAYDCFINGERIYNNTIEGKQYYELKSNYTEFNISRFYLTFDVTPMLVNGKNAISAITSDSWWSDKINGWLGIEDAFKCKMVIKYSDGTQQIITTNTDTWKTSAASPMYRAEMFSGECFDNRVDTSWKFVGYDDSKWLPPVVNTENAGNLKPWIGEKIQVREDLILKPQSIITYSGSTGGQEGVLYGNITNVEKHSGPFTLQPGQTALIDFGQNSAGWENFTVNGDSGAKLIIKHAEILNEPDGRIDRGNFGPGGSASYYNLRSCKATTEYVLSGQADETYHPSLSYYGYRYIEITTDKPVTLSNICSLTLSSVQNDAGYIKTNDEKINKIISNAKWGMYSNYLAVPTDCPQRDERQGWTADAQVFAETAMYMADVEGFLRKFCNDIRDAQLRHNQNGIYPATAPFSEWGGNAWGDTGWADCGVIVPYIMYSMYGDISILEDSWNSMDNYVRLWIPTKDSDDEAMPHRGPGTVLGDWHVPNQAELNRPEIKNVIAAEYYCWDLKMMCDIAKILNKDESVIKYYSDKYIEIKTWFNDHYCTSGSLAYPESQTVAAYALYLDLIDDENVKANTILALENNIHEFGDKLKTGFLGTRVLLDALTKINRPDLAYTILTSEENPGWLFTVNNGATTFWERWDSYDKNKGYYKSTDVAYTNSFNHYSYGAVVSWMYRNMLGINKTLDNPGFKQIEFSPFPALKQYNNINVNHVEGTYNSEYGLISVDSNYNNGIWKYNFTTPTNTTVKLKIPKIFSTYSINGVNYTDLNFDIDGAQLVEENEDFLIFDVKCGTFLLECCN